MFIKYGIQKQPQNFFDSYNVYSANQKVNIWVRDTNTFG